ncbi:MAG TPA: hypothetical protein VGW38_09705 [Chloroflexota bacterium]|nr:hypothetical protein [Chloroflexota bacterium]
MQIEAERGFTPSCYTCLMLEDAGPAYNSGVRADFNDYRNMVGFMGQSTAISTTVIRHGLSMTSQRSTLDLLKHDDYVLRAWAFAWAGPTANAQQLLEAFDIVVEQMWLPGGQYLGPAHIGTLVYSWYGYAYTPPVSDPIDQMMTMYYGLLAVETTMPDVLMANFNRDTDGWYSVLMTSSPPFPSLAEYMQTQPHWQTFRS